MTKRLKTLLGLLVVVVGIAGVYFLFMDTASAPSDMATSTAQTATTSLDAKAAVPARTPARTTPGTSGSTASAPVTAGVSSAAPVILWRFSANDEDGTTNVTVVADEKPHELGSFLGTCKTIAAEDLKSANEISGVLCLKDEKGTEIGVFRSGNTFVVQKGDIEQGDVETRSKRGPFVTILTLP